MGHSAASRTIYELEGVVAEEAEVAEKTLILFRQLFERLGGQGFGVPAAGDEGSRQSLQTLLELIGTLDPVALYKFRLEPHDFAEKIAHVLAIFSLFGASTQKIEAVTGKFVAIFDDQGIFPIRSHVDEDDPELRPSGNSLDGEPPRLPVKSFDYSSVDEVVEILLDACKQILSALCPGSFGEGLSRLRPGNFQLHFRLRLFLFGGCFS